MDAVAPFAAPSLELFELLSAAAAEPEDVSRRLVLADWLEERGDPRCEFVREFTRTRSLARWKRQHGAEWPGLEVHRALTVWHNGLALKWPVGASQGDIQWHGWSLVEQGWVTNLLTYGGDYLHYALRQPFAHRIRGMRVRFAGGESQTYDWSSMPRLLELQCVSIPLTRDFARLSGLAWLCPKLRKLLWWHGAIESDELIEFVSRARELRVFGVLEPAMLNADVIRAIDANTSIVTLVVVGSRMVRRRLETQFRRKIAIVGHSR